MTTRTRAKHAIKTCRTTDELEARDTRERPLRFNLNDETAHSYHDEDYVILTSADGDIFLGHIDEVDIDEMKFYVKLD